MSFDRVVGAVTRLQQLSLLTRAGQWLPGFFALKANKLSLAQAVTLGGTAFAEFCEQYYNVPSPPQPGTPWFDPLTHQGGQAGPWKYANWPRGTFASRSDRSLLVKKGVLEVSGKGELLKYTLKDGYVVWLNKYFASPMRVPVFDFTAWMLRGHLFDDSATPDDAVKELLVNRLHLTADEVKALFEVKVANEPNFFTPTNWPLVQLTPKLPPPKGTTTPKSSATDEEGDEAEAEDDEVIVEPPPQMSDAAFVENLVKHLRDVEHFEVDVDFVRAVVYALRVDRFVILCGKPGTGKTEFVAAFSRALAITLPEVAVRFVHHEVHPETAEWEIVGSRDLGGTYVPSPFMRDLCAPSNENDLQVVMLDEMNRGLVDAYAGRLLAAISNRVPIDLPGQVKGEGLPAGGRWGPGPGVLLFAGVNSPLTEPARAPLSGPVKRRAHLIPMPNPLTRLASKGDDEAKAQFRLICEQKLLGSR